MSNILTGALFGLCAIAVAAEKAPARPETIHALVEHLYVYYPTEVRRVTTQELLRGIAAHLTARTSETLTAPRQWSFDDWEAATRRMLIAQLYTARPSPMPPTALENLLHGMVGAIASDVEAELPPDQWRPELNRRLLLHALWIRGRKTSRPIMESELPEPRRSNISHSRLSLAFDYWYDELYADVRRVPWAQAELGNAFGIEDLSLTPLLWPAHFSVQEVHPALGSALLLRDTAGPSTRSAYFAHRVLLGPTATKTSIVTIPARDRGLISILDAPSWVSPDNRGPRGNGAMRTTNVLLAEAFRALGFPQDSDADPFYAHGAEWDGGSEFVIVERPLRPRKLVDGEERNVRAIAALAILDRIEKGYSGTEDLPGLSSADSQPWRRLRTFYERTSKRDEQSPSSVRLDRAEALKQFLLSENRHWIEPYFFVLEPNAQQILLADLLRADPTAESEQFFAESLPAAEGPLRQRVLDVLQIPSIAFAFPNSLLEAFQKVALAWPSADRIRLAWIAALRDAVLAVGPERSEGRVIENAVAAFSSDYPGWESSAEIAVWELRHPLARAHKDGAWAPPVHRQIGAGIVAAWTDIFETAGSIWNWVSNPPEPTEREFLTRLANDRRQSLEKLSEQLRYRYRLFQRCRNLGWIPEQSDLQIKKHAKFDWEFFAEALALRAFREGRARLLLDVFGDDAGAFQAAVSRAAAFSAQAPKNRKPSLVRATSALVRSCALLLQPGGPHTNE